MINNDSLSSGAVDEKSTYNRYADHPIHINKVRFNMRCLTYCFISVSSFANLALILISVASTKIDTETMVLISTGFMVFSILCFLVFIYAVIFTHRFGCSGDNAGCVTTTSLTALPLKNLWTLPICYTLQLLNEPLTAHK